MTSMPEIGPISDPVIRILLLESNAGDAALIQGLLSRSQGESSFEVKTTDRAGLAVDKLSKEAFDVVIMDLELPDSKGLESFLRINKAHPALPVIVLAGPHDETLAFEAVSRGAQDYVVKGETSERSLGRVIRYAIERARLLNALRSLSLIDQLTGLYNRRGFTTLADQQVKLAIRAKRNLMLVLTDVDGLKAINDGFGHREGDLALIKAAEVLKKTFRKSDVIARIGGDEFALLAIEANKDSQEIFRARIRQNLEECGSAEKLRYALSMSVGITFFEGVSPLTLTELLDLADQSLYADKKAKKSLKHAYGKGR